MGLNKSFSASVYIELVEGVSCTNFHNNFRLTARSEESAEEVLARLVAIQGNVDKAVRELRDEINTGINRELSGCPCGASTTECPYKSLKDCPNRDEIYDR
jgi:hypothetical protein